jgi:hypothetical protein
MKRNLHRGPNYEQYFGLFSLFVGRSDQRYKNTPVANCMIGWVPKSREIAHAKTNMILKFSKGIYA